MSDMPYGYRWLTDDEQEQLAALDADERRWGWMRDEYHSTLDGKPIIQWDCMIEFGMDHDHDAVECERIMADMNAPAPDEMDYSGWYGGERGYNDGLRWSDFI